MDLDKLDSATKYPSIFTHHQLGEKGMLQDDLGPFQDVHPDTLVYLREKVDGTNGRIVFAGNDYFIGSRENLLYARGDRIVNPALGIVEALRPLAEQMVAEWEVTDYPYGSDDLMVLYLEVYGGKIGAAAKQYTGSGRVGYALFDYVLVDRKVLGWEKAQIARWRDDEGGQNFGDVQDIRIVADEYSIPMVPNLGAVHLRELPTDLEGMLAFMKRELPDTRADFDDDAKGMPEGIVLRTADRKVISKARFQDYERTLKRRGGK